MKKINCLIVDDERLARIALKDNLKAFSHLKVVGEAANAVEAKEMIESLKPELIFLDIQMPEVNGFELLEKLEFVPHVIFVTAYDQYALKAFEVSALDYVVKPIRNERLEIAVNKYSGKIDSAPSSDNYEMDNRVFVKDGENCHFIKIANIRFIESVGNYARLHFEKDKVLIKKSLNQLEKKLPSEFFFRCNRSDIININFIEKIDPMFKGVLRITVNGNHKIDLSERKSVLFKDKMSL